MKYLDLWSQLTETEKICLLTGRDFWTTHSVERLGIPSIWLADGPHGVRKATSTAETGIGTSLPATCFPTAATLSCTWDEALVERVGRAIGRECRHQGVHVLLGPGLNLKRHPLGGRNFEYYSEDPLLSGKLAAAFIRGVQTQGVAACAKHFAVNNQETDRMRIDALVAARPLRELYLRQFEIALREGRPQCVMASYNRLNGIFCSEHRWLLRELLYDEWGFDGVVISDWGAVNDRAAALCAGLTLEMPGNGGTSDRVLQQALHKGDIRQSDIDNAAVQLLRLVLQLHDAAAQPLVADYEAHHELAIAAAVQSLVLLKNEDGILPLSPGLRVAVIGQFAQYPRFQGGGSSQVVPTHLTNLWDALHGYLPGEQLHYAVGYEISGQIDEAQINEAQRIARRVDVAVLCVGLPDSYESEGFDRTHLHLPPGHDALVRAVAAVQPRTVVVLTSGAPVVLPWIEQVPAVLWAGLAGQGAGEAMARVLCGQVSPSGKLTETWPQRLEDTPAYHCWPGDGWRVHYGEGLFVGYRWYDMRQIEPLFPFGHGLSYANFAYLSLSGPDQLPATLEGACWHLRLRNTGMYPATEIVQLYVHPPEGPVRRPKQELAAWARVSLEPGQEQVVTLVAEPTAFQHWDPARQAWVTCGGCYELRVGASSRDIRLRHTIEVETPVLPPRLDRFSPIREWLSLPEAKQVLEPLVEALANKMAGPQAPAKGIAFMRAVLYDLPLHKLVGFTSGHFSFEMIETLLNAAKQRWANS